MISIREQNKETNERIVWNLNSSVNLFKIIAVCASFLCQTENFSNYPHICTDSLYCYDTHPVLESHTVIVLYYKFWTVAIIPEFLRYWDDIKEPRFVMYQYWYPVPHRYWILKIDSRPVSCRYSILTWDKKIPCINERSGGSTMHHNVKTLCYLYYFIM